MILRGSSLSDKRVALEGARTERPPLAPVRSSAPAASPSSSAAPSAAVASPVVTESAVVDVPPPSPSPPVPQLPPEPPPLTLERVREWIDNSDDSTRAALAAVLADDIASLREEAREKGFAQGAKQGAEAAAAQATSTLALLSEVAGQAEAAFSTDAEKLAAECATVVAEALARIAGPSLVTPEAALGSVLEVLKRVKEEREVIIRVRAADLPALREHESRIEAALAGRRFSLVADPRLEAGGCMVESSLGSLDGRLEVQLRSLCETVRMAALARREPT